MRVSSRRPLEIRNRSNTRPNNDAGMDKQPLGWLERYRRRLELGADERLEVALCDDPSGKLDRASGHLGVAREQWSLAP